jgi:hypothetical protein
MVWSWLKNGTLVLVRVAPNGPQTIDGLQASKAMTKLQRSASLCQKW